MSHIALVTLAIKDLECLKKAAERCDLEYIDGQKQFRTYGGKLDACDHALRVKGNSQAYEIGVRRDAQNPGTFQLAWDSYAGGYGLVEKVGTNCNRLKDFYGVEVAKKDMRRKGFRVQETTSNGRPRLVCQR